MDVCSADGEVGGDTQSGGPDRERVRQTIERGEWSRLAGQLGYEAVGAALTPTSAGSWGLESDWIAQFDKIEVLAAGSGVRIILVEGDVPWRSFRSGVIQASKNRPATTVMWWWVRDATIVAAFGDRRKRGGWYLRTLETSRKRPDPAGIEQWTRLDVSAVVAPAHGDEAGTIAQHIRRVFEEDGLTREFFDGFAGALERLRETLQCGPDDEQQRHDVALSTLLRCLFLYFLQARDWLDGDRRYVVRHLDRCLRSETPFYRSVLRPLFFGALNCEPGQRSERADKLGSLPFLNGGLFEPLPVEREHPEMRWPNSVWQEVIEGLLERYHFTVEPAHGDDDRRAVDPEMLGKVFEGLMYGNRRKRSGSYYTPRDVVRRLVVDAIGGYLADETGLSGAKLRRWLRSVEEAAPGIWSVQQQKELLGALGKLRLLDPAVGTGAFLLEAFHVLRGARQRLDPGTTDDFEQSVSIIHDHLFGVDVQQTAVRICELRLWLALLPSLRDRSIEALPALPNLGHRVGCGDSLTTPPGRPNGATNAFESPVAEVMRGDIQTLQREYFRAHGGRKVALYRRLEDKIRACQRRLLEGRREHLRRRLDPIENLSDSKDLFGDEVELSEDQQRARSRLESEIQQVCAAIEDLEAGRSSRASFDFEAWFGPSLSERGFQVIATNPPWVRTRRIDKQKRRRLKETYRCFSGGLWRGAKKAGVRTPFGLQVDLSSVFIERALSLLAPGGRLSVLMPAKGLRSLHGSGLRRILSEHEIVRVEDYSEAAESMFDATVYPAVLEVRECRSWGESGDDSSSCEVSGADTAAEIAVWQGEQRHTFRRHPRDLRVVSDDSAAPWTPVPSGVLDGLDSLFDSGQSLGSVRGIRVQRGVMTGKNEVFIDTPEGFSQKFDDDLLEGWTRPVIGGRDISASGIEAERRIIWPIDRELNCRRHLPESLSNYFEARRGELENRADHRQERPLWQLFRLNEGIDSPKVVWRDLSPALQAAVAPDEIVPLNTVYFVPCPDMSRSRSLVQWFHSLPVRLAVRTLAERARGGWRRHFAWVVRLIPAPTALARWWSGDIQVDSLTGAEREFAESSGSQAPIAPTHRRKLVAEIAGWSPTELTKGRDWLLSSLPEGNIPEDIAEPVTEKLTA